MQEEILPENAAIDLPSDSDFREEFAGAQDDLPGRVILDYASFQNQGISRVPSTKMACTCFSASHSCNIGAGGDVTDAVSLWSEALTQGASEKDGWYVKSAIHLAYKKGFCTYQIITGDRLYGIRSSISKRIPVACGSNLIDWKATRDNGWTAMFLQSPGFGHAFMFDGYDDDEECLYVRDSYGTESRIGGRFKIKYSDIDKLYTSYQVLPADSFVKDMLETRNEKMLKAAHEQGVWNGERRDDSITRRESVLVIGRTFWPQFDDERILSLDIWNGNRGDETSTRREFVIMLMRSQGHKGTDEYLMELAYKNGVWSMLNKDMNITRRESVLMVMRLRFPYMM